MGDSFQNNESVIDQLMRELQELPSRKDVDIHDELAEHRSKKAEGGPPVPQESTPHGLQKKVESFSEELLIMEQSLSRERLRRKEVEERLEKTEKSLNEVYEDMEKFHKMYGTRVDVWLQSTPKWVRSIYYPVRVLFVCFGAMTLFNVPTGLMALAFDWTGLAKFLWFGALAGFVGFFVFGFLSKLTAPDWAKKKEPDKPDKKDPDLEDLQTL